MSNMLYKPVLNVLKFIMWSPKPDMVDIYEADITGLTLLDLQTMTSGKFISTNIGKLVKTMHFKELKVEYFVFLDAWSSGFYVKDYNDYDDYEDEISGFFQLSFKLMVDGKTPTFNDLSKYNAIDTLNKALQSCE